MWRCQAVTVVGPVAHAPTARYSHGALLLHARAKREAFPDWHLMFPQASTSQSSQSLKPLIVLCKHATILVTVIRIRFLLAFCFLSFCEIG